MNYQSTLNDRDELRHAVAETVATTPMFDMHTHLFAPQFKGLNLWGIDELLTYHYLIAELFRSATITPEEFWQLNRARQADLIWEELFVRRTPLSEATLGVVSVLKKLGHNTRAENLQEAREFFREQSPADYLDRVLTLAGVTDVVMTNDPFDAEEAQVWINDREFDERFHAALRLDRMLNGWHEAQPELERQGYGVSLDAGGSTIKEARRFLDEWIERMSPLYLAVSLPDDFLYPETSVRNRLIEDVVIPCARGHRLPLALMIGVRRGVNPRLRLAGDGLGLADVGSVVRLCAAHPENRFLVTMLARENQHELCVVARKFSNLMIFGCWWFLNNTSIIREITQERIELLGTSFIPQHSDARVLDQLIYKWRHSRALLAEVLAESYLKLFDAGRTVTRGEIERDVARMLRDNFADWVGLSKSAHAAAE